MSLTPAASVPLCVSSAPAPCGDSTHTQPPEHKPKLSKESLARSSIVVVTPKPQQALRGPLARTSLSHPLVKQPIKVFESKEFISFLWPTLDDSERVYVCALPAIAYGHIVVQDPPDGSHVVIAKELIRNGICSYCGLANITRKTAKGSRPVSFGVCSRECARAFFDTFSKAVVPVASPVDGKVLAMKQCPILRNLFGWLNASEGAYNVGMSTLALWRNVCEWLGTKNKHPKRSSETTPRVCYVVCVCVCVSVCVCVCVCVCECECV